MTYKSIYFVLAIFLSLDLQPLLAEDSVVISTTIKSSTKCFVEYLNTVATTLDAIEREQLELDETIISASRCDAVAQVAKLIDEIEALFEKGAFVQLPALKEKFYAIFNNDDVIAWPTPALVRSWRVALTAYRDDLLTHLDAIEALPVEAYKLDYAVLQLIEIPLYEKLMDKVLTEQFFKFSALEKIADSCVARPIEFAKAHPYITLAVGTALLVVVGGVVYHCMAEKVGEAEDSSIESVVDAASLEHESSGEFEEGEAEVVVPNPIEIVPSDDPIIPVPPKKRPVAPITKPRAKKPVPAAPKIPVAPKTRPVAKVPVVEPVVVVAPAPAPQPPAKIPAKNRVRRRIVLPDPIEIPAVSNHSSPSPRRPGDYFDDDLGDDVVPAAVASVLSAVPLHSPSTSDEKGSPVGEMQPTGPNPVAQGNKVSRAISWGIKNIRQYGHAILGRPVSNPQQ